MLFAGLFALNLHNRALCKTVSWLMHLLSLLLHWQMYTCTDNLIGNLLSFLFTRTPVTAKFYNFKTHKTSLNGISRLYFVCFSIELMMLKEAWSIRLWFRKEAIVQVRCYCFLWFSIACHLSQTCNSYWKETKVDDNDDDGCGEKAFLECCTVLICTTGPCTIAAAVHSTLPMKVILVHTVSSK